MRHQRQLPKRSGSGWFAILLLACLAVSPVFAANHDADDLLNRTGEQVSSFLGQFSDVKCTEKVTQEKLGKDEKVELKEESTYDYLVILTNTSGELSLDESRLAVHEAKADKKNTSLLVTNGFATLFLVFHPYYAGSFRFTAQGDEVVAGHLLSKISFQHVRGTRSVAALALRGKEYPLEVSGTAWIDPQTAVIQKIAAEIGDTMQDVGLKTLRSEVQYAPVPFRGMKETYWFPSQATVEVETPRQHWRNTHRFTDYKRFSVDTEEQVANK
ncbi:MAG: hypothetical protein LAO56_25810 [Acidobacteriia bacterium]|jgi:hypothetical protein|nr:hypothetical protein [Terriglobia bacterium]